MNIEELRIYCLQLPGTSEEFPFDEETLVFKVSGKIFLLSDIHSKPLRFNAKCDPEKAIILREEYDCIIPGYHMNKKHWNTVICDGRLSEKKIQGLINDSYNLVVKGLSKREQEKLSGL